MIYEVLFIEVPTAKEQEEGKVEKVINKYPICVAAKDEKIAAIKAKIELIGALQDWNKVEVLVRPFGIWNSHKS